MSSQTSKTWSVYWVGNDNPVYPKLGVKVVNGTTTDYYQFFVGGQKMFVLDRADAEALSGLLKFALDATKPKIVVGSEREFESPEALMEHMKNWGDNGEDSSPQG